MSVSSEYIQTIVRRLKYYKDLADKTIAQLSDEELNYQPNDVSNSVAIIIQHMVGNMLSRWTNFLEEDGEKPWRKRDAEFTGQNFSKEELLNIWEKGWSCFLEAISPLTKSELKKEITIRGESLSVIDAINRQTAHYPYHVGQIIYIGKMIRGNNWQQLSIPKGHSELYNKSDVTKDPAKKY